MAEITPATRAWEQGIGTFFYDGVPFSFSTGRAFADAIARFLLVLRTGPVVVEELGAGLGLLSRQMVSAMLVHAPDMPLQIHVSEFSATMVAQLRALGIFDGLSDVTVSQDSCFSIGQSPDLRIMAYVLDALPVRQFEIRPEGLWERHVKKIAPDSVVWDGRFFPPRPVSVAAILADPNAPLSLWRQVWPHMTTEETYIPCTWDSITPDDRQLLQRIASDYPNGVRCNYIPNTVALLDGLIARLATNGGVLIYDVGVTIPNVSEAMLSWQDLQTDYGLTTCWVVFFPMIQAWAQWRGIQCRITTLPNGNSQMLYLSRAEISEEAWKILETVCREYRHEAYIQAMAVATPIFDGDYSVTMAQAIAAYEACAYSKVQTHLAPLLACYGPVAVSAWLLWGKAAKALGNITEAKQAFEKAHCAAPEEEHVLYELAAIALKEQKYAQYCDYAKSYLLHRVALPDVWETVLTIILCMRILGQEAEALQAIQCIREYVSVPEAILKKLSAIAHAG